MSVPGTSTARRAPAARDRGPSRGSARLVVLRVGLVLAVFAIAGAVAGVVWEWLWTPPLGLVYRDQWILEPAGPDYAFSGTGWYVVVALVAGLLTSAVLAWALVGRELTTLVSAAIGSVLAGWLMFTVGHALGPPDPRPLAAGMEDLERLPSDLRVAGASADPVPFSLESSAFTAFPVGSTVGLTLVWFTTRGRRVRGVGGPHAG